ncbi:uncharacterized protein TA10615 [Theileria annulata]|uniref:Uncharacterized protein n=1 Tax=Theileria annulata TaxID=5874 RepID=Q4U922_THEAN|nr:uncharacterized protein TA10615 [Theileria annulata]CAI76681.1 hypothetical protein, conserved [Theileria annulata]|eukprot:XP_953306.1 hypothetical protein, conserved [Theileria annulata]
MAIKVNWAKTAIASGVVAAAAVLLYYVFKNDDEEEEEYDSYKQTFNSSTMSTSRVEKMTRKECFDLLKKIADSQDETKNLMATLVDDILNGRLPSKILDVYQRALPAIPNDPLESRGLTLFDLDHLVDKYQNDPSIRECILNIMNMAPTEGDDENISLDELIKVHEYMLAELGKMVSSYRKMPNKDSLDKKALTVALQALISAKVQDKFGYSYSSIDRAVIKNHTDLSMNTKFARLTMQMQSEMSEITG